MQESTEAGCKFNIVQPGSSVATALSEGESKKKHVVLLEVNGEQFRTINYPLESVRPFIHDNVNFLSPQYCKCMHHRRFRLSKACDASSSFLLQQMLLQFKDVLLYSD